MNLRSGRLPFQVQVVDSPATVTAHAGLPLVIEAFRSLSLPAAIEQHLHFKQRLRGYSETTCIETLVALLKGFGLGLCGPQVMHYENAPLFPKGYHLARQNPAADAPGR